MPWGVVKYRETRKVLYGYILQGIGYTAEHQDIEVRRVTKASQTIKRVDVGFQKVGPSAHFREHDKIVKITHALAYQIGFAARRALHRWACVGGKVTHQIRVHSLVFKVL
jgi:hypothetical protein